ncbi:MAG: GGDEF domain-containing protein, partial [Spirochaetaceae bacterium]|nr:GGDEF domain-containing protein [Spirochaetaceae bacterium]
FYYAACAAEIAAFFFSLYMYKKSSLSAISFKIGFTFFVFFLTLFCVYLYTASRSPFAVRFLLMLLSFQTIFVLDTVALIIINAAVISVFFVIRVYYGKISGTYVAANSVFDILNTVFSSLICVTFNWYISRSIIRGIIERNHDQLTGLNNRRSFEQSVNFYTSVCRHVHQTVCVIMMDVDFFKNYNDLYGHTRGDNVLQMIGKTLKELSDEYRLYAARVGGEEFIIMWTENRLLEAERMALKIRKKIIDLQIPHEKSAIAPYITASFGMYFMRGGSTDSMRELYNYADIALYRAKEAGRNCIAILDSAGHTCRLVELRPPDELVRP